MKHATSLLAGAGLALAVSWLLSAAAPAPAAAPSPQLPASLGKGRTVFGLSVLQSSGKPLEGLDKNTPVTVQDVQGGWLLVDFPTQRTGPVWINGSAVVSFRVNR